jgi:hypothetical protein
MRQRCVCRRQNASVGRRGGEAAPPTTQGLGLRSTSHSVEPQRRNSVDVAGFLSCCHATRSTAATATPQGRNAVRPTGTGAASRGLGGPFATPLQFGLGPAGLARSNPKHSMRQKGVSRPDARASPRFFMYPARRPALCHLFASHASGRCDDERVAESRVEPAPRYGRRGVCRWLARHGLPRPPPLALRAGSRGPDRGSRPERSRKATRATRKPLVSFGLLILYRHICRLSSQTRRFPLCGRVYPGLLALALLPMLLVLLVVEQLCDPRPCSSWAPPFGASKSVGEAAGDVVDDSSSASWLSISSQTSLRSCAVASPGRRAASRPLRLRLRALLHAEEVDMLPRATWDGWKSHPARYFSGGDCAARRPQDVHIRIVKCDQLLQRAM